MGGDDAVEHIDAAVDGFEDVEGGADAHEVAGAVGGEEGGGEGAGVFAFGFGFADGEAADGEAVEGEGGEAGGAFVAEVVVEGALNDGEEGLGGVAAGGEAAFGPALGDGEGGAGGAAVGGGGDALVEDHHDVAADAALGEDGALGAEEDGLAVDVALEDGAGFAHGAGVGEGEDLEAAGVGEDGAVPLHEAVDAAEALEDFGAGAEEEVVGIGEEDLGAGVFEGFGELGFDRGLGADGHEEGGADLVVEGAEDGGPGAGALGEGFKAEIQTGGHHGRAAKKAGGGW